MNRKLLSAAIVLMLAQSALLLACGGGGGGTPSAATPGVAHASADEDAQTASGLVISRHVTNGAEVSHFKITGITGGTLYQNNGTTSISNGEFITFTQGQAGLRFTPSANSTSNGSFTVQASTAGNDAGLGGGTVTATITVRAVNDAPTIANAIPDPTATEGSAFSFQFAAQASADPDAGDSLTYTATRTDGSALPGWPTFNAGTRTFSGTPASGDVGALAVRVTATDSAAASAFDDFALAVSSAVAAGPGWTLTTGNTGLAGVGLTCAALPLYTGPMKPAANTTIRLVRITWEELDLSNGNIVLDRVCIQPATAGGRSSMVFGYNPDTGNNQLGPVTIQDSDIDGSRITNTSIYANCAFRGAANLVRNRMFGMGSGICYFGSPTVTASVIEGNYVHGLRSGFYGTPPQQSHNESATVRSFGGTSLLWTNNRLESLSGADSGALFIQTTGNIQNVTVRGNLFHTTAWNLALEAKNGNTYANMQAINNRFVVPPGGFGAAYVDGGPGWSDWSENYRYDAAAPDGKGLPVGRP